jgi:hypothetical protein
MQCSIRLWFAELMSLARLSSELILVILALNSQYVSMKDSLPSSCRPVSLSYSSWSCRALYTSHTFSNCNLNICIMHIHSTLQALEVFLDIHHSGFLLLCVFGESVVLRTGKDRANFRFKCYDPGFRLRSWQQCCIGVVFRSAYAVAWCSVLRSSSLKFCLRCVIEFTLTTIRIRTTNV